MDEVNIQITKEQSKFVVGDTISGVADVVLSDDITPANVEVSFHCVGEVRWTENPSTPFFMDGQIYFADVNFHQEVLKFSDSDVKVINNENNSKVSIPFSFAIPKDKNLPSSLNTKQGFIKYFIQVTINEHDKIKKFHKDLTVYAPMEKDLGITVGGSVDKVVLYHKGTVAMHASIDRKGYAPGETISVHVTVDNKTNAKVVPQVELHQVQIYMSGVRHKTIETTVSEEATSGTEIEPHTNNEEVLELTIPTDQTLSIKSTLATVKYFVRVVLYIPHSLDLHINLPVVVTAQSVVDQLPPK